MATKTITISGEDKDELIAEATAVLEMLGGEAPAAEEAGDDDTGTDDDGLGDGLGEDDETEALKAKLKKIVVAASKTAKGPDAVRVVFKKVKANRLADVPDDKLAAVLKALAPLAKSLKVKLD